MEKKVNLTIFFNYRSYSPRFKLLLEDVFYKKMHDEKLSSSDAMQQVMKFCNDVDAIEYVELDSDILSRYSKETRKILINSMSLNKLMDEHKDLDEEALLKNILGKQTQNVLLEDASDSYDVTFEDVLNRNGYAAPRKLSDIAREEKGIDDDFSIVDEIVTPKIARKSEVRNIQEVEQPITVTEEDKRFLSNDETMQISRVQEELRQKVESKKVSFKNFFPEDDELGETEEAKDYPKIGILSRRFNIEEPEDNFELLDCIKRKDDELSNNNFSDFVPQNDYSNYMLEDEEETNENKVSILDSVKSKVSSFADKIKTSLASKKKQDDEEYDEEMLDAFYNKSLDTDVKEENITETYTNNTEDFTEYEDNLNTSYMGIEEEEVKLEENIISKPKNTFSDLDMSLESDIEDKDIMLDDKFDNIISAIMKEKEKEIEEDEMLSYVEEHVEDDHMTSVYDSFAEELETVETVKKRRRNR